MTQYLLALHKADDEHRSPEQTRQVWADLDVLHDRLTDAGAFVFQGGLIPAESATVVRQSGGDFLITDGPYTETKERGPWSRSRCRGRAAARRQRSSPRTSDQA